MSGKVSIGDRFGHLEVVSRKSGDKRGNTWYCLCDCGKETIKSDYQLLGTSGRRTDKSCGCSIYRYEGRVNKNLRLYHIWYGMKRRCYDKNSGSYKRYGAKGIGVSEEWMDDFDNFLEWSLEHGYKDGLTLDRINSNQDYSPENCRWSTYEVQMQTRGKMGNNKTGVTGVSYSKKEGKYIANIQRNGINKRLGSFLNLADAKEARVKAEEHFKKYGNIEKL